MVSFPIPSRARFVQFSLCAIGVLLLIQTLSAIEAKGPASRVRDLMPVIGAQWVDRALSDRERAYPLEIDKAGQSPTLYRLGDLPEDTLVFLNFWATWCKPCVAEIPSMISLRRAMAGRPFVILAVSYDSDWVTVNDFFKRVLGGNPREFVLLRDPETSDTEMLRTSLGTSRLPETYVIRNGRILSRFVNARDWTDPAIIEYFERLSEMP